MGAFTTSEFTSLLDELIARTAAEEPPRPQPSMAFGYVAPGEAVEALWANVPGDFVAGLYGLSPERGVLTDAPGIETPEPPRPPLPSVEPADIAAELRMSHARWPKDFDRIRRDFAMRNHPDRVEAALRERAVVRMQIANMMIDREKQKAAARG